MASTAGDDSTGWDAGGGGTPTTTPAWPYVDRRKQAALEAKYLEAGATVDFARLPAPSALGRLLGAGAEPRRTLMVVTRVTSVGASAGRPLRQPEIDTLAEQGARAAGRMAWIMPLAVAGAGVLTWVDRGRFRFPFYTPPRAGWFDPRAFPTRRFALVRGRNAGAAWHGARFAAYLPLCWLGTSLFVASMVRTRFLADMADPRLEDLRNDIQHRQLAQGQKARPPGMPHPANPENAEAWQDRYQFGEAASSSSSSASPSPSSAAPAWPAAPPASSAARQSSGGATAPSAPWTPPRSSAKEPQTPFDDTELFDDDDDDASPVPASVRRAERQQAAQQAARQQPPAGSSWSRVRQQAGVSGAPPAAATAGDETPRSRTTSAWSRVRQGGSAATGDRPTGGGEDYTYSESGDDKSQAQKQFDDMLEAERQGGSGSSSSRGGKRSW